MCLYTPLNASKREIRLLRVLQPDGSAAAAAADNHITCELSVHQLGESTGTTVSYTALSYVWGPEPPPSPPPPTITVNNKVLPARENLVAALQAFRRRGETGCIWVDAVCINQADREEKKTQIPLMGDIYGLAAQTFIWLGVASEGDESDLAMETLDKLDPSQFEMACFSEEQGRRWRAVMGLLQRPWWRRTWIVQEAFLSTKPIAWCGDKAIPFERFVTLKELYDASYWKDQTKWLSYPLFQNVPFTSCLSNWHITRRQLTHDGDSVFCWVVTNSHLLECTEPHDRIYGVLGMCYADDRKAIVADYEKRLRDVIIDVVLRSVPTLRLLFLSFVGPEDAKNRDLELPTWVPDITALDVTQRVDSASASEESFNASLGETHPAWTTLFQNSTLPADEAGLTSLHSREKELFCLYGCLCDVVTDADDMPHIPQYRGYDTQLAAENKARRAKTSIKAFRKWESLAIGATEAPQAPESRHVARTQDIYAGLPGGRKEAFWRSLSCDSAVRGRRPLPQDYGQRYETLLGRRRPPSSLGTDEAGENFEPLKNGWVREYAAHAVAKCFNKSFFLTHRGRIGVGVRGTKKEDIVIIARGSKVPYVLRRVGDGSFRFVGEAYVHGVMDGEAVEEAVRLGWQVIKFLMR